MKKKKFGRIENDILVYAPKHVRYNHKIYFNPRESILRELGYKELVFDDFPYDQLDEKHAYSEVYTETETTIYISYEVYEV